MKLIEPTDGKIILTSEEVVILKKARYVLEGVEQNLKKLQEIEELNGEGLEAEEASYLAEDSIEFITHILNGWHYCTIEEESEE